MNNKNWLVIGVVVLVALGVYNFIDVSNSPRNVPSTETGLFNYLGGETDGNAFEQEGTNGIYGSSNDCGCNVGNQMENGGWGSSYENFIDNCVNDGGLWIGGYTPDTRRCYPLVLDYGTVCAGECKEKVICYVPKYFENGSINPAGGMRVDFREGSCSGYYYATTTR